ncbi:MAG: hypothetical protein JOY83_17155 [Alphaproteobacteria bacterium]|nr:hypothetical protein [Alphaproteobacteria bacterium]
MDWCGRGTRQIAWTRAGRSLSRRWKTLWRIPGIGWQSLQVGSPPEEISHVPHQPIVDLSPLLSDFAESAAAIRHPDLVISVETAVAHLPGPLGQRYGFR